MFGPPEDVEGECNARRFLADDYGDNNCTFRCQLEPGHTGLHRVQFGDTFGDGIDNPTVITWTIDDRIEEDKKKKEQAEWEAKEAAEEAKKTPEEKKKEAEKRKKFLDECTRVYEDTQKKLNIDMSPVEHSRLLYLLDALESAPGKSDSLLFMATKPDASLPYQEALQRLQKAVERSTLLEECTQLRLDLL